MAYNNYLIKVGNYEIPLTFMKIESYSVTYSTMDLDPYRDANGVLHRNALAHKAGHIDFETPYMLQSDFVPIMANIRSQYSNATEKRVSASFYVPELDDYINQDMYLADVEIKILQNSPRGFIYGNTKFQFVAY